MFKKKTAKYSFVLLAALLLCAGAGEGCQAESPDWVNVEDGVESVVLTLPVSSNSTAVESTPAEVAILRLDPNVVDFELLMASELGQARTLSEWARQYDLIAAINASMYLPDGLTSTGYMRRDGHANNDRVVNGFGAFFVAMPDTADLPSAAVLDRNLDDWEGLLSHYRIVIQNFRMMDSEGQPLWNGTTRPFSIAAVGQDAGGKILFFHSSQPLTVNAFVQGLLALPLDIKRLMYVEGGYQAAMLVNSPGQTEIWTGKYSPLLQVSALQPLPNVIGVKRKNVAE